MTTFRKALPLLALFAALAGLPLAAQGTDCAFTFSFTGDATQTAVSNLSGQTPCVNWRITYSVTGTLTSTVTFQVSPDATPANFVSVTNTPCSSTQQPPCVIQGTNPLTGTTYGMAYFAAYGAYVRVITTGSAGAGTGTVRGYGAKGASASAGGSGGGSGTVTDTLGPLPVNAVILGNGTNDVKPGSVLPADPTKFYDGNGNFSPVPSAGTLTYYFTNTASSIATYLQATAAPFTPKTTLSFTALATGTDTLQNWATNAGVPNLTFIPAGVFTAHLHALRTGGGTVTLFVQFWEVNAAGVDIAQIGTNTESTPALTTGELEYPLQMATANVYVMTSAASRVVARVFAVVSGSAPTVQIFVGGTADTHLSLPSNTVDATNFVPYIGATATVDLATHDLLTGTGNGGFGVDARTGNAAPQQKLVVWGGDMLLADPAAPLAVESLTNGALTSGTSWTTTGDFTLTANAATYAHSAGSGTLQQAAGTLALPGTSAKWYKFVYTISAVTPGVTACSITSAFADTGFGTSFDITAGVAKIFYFKSAAIPGNFVISCTSTAGGLTLDDLSLKAVRGGNLDSNGIISIAGGAGFSMFFVASRYPTLGFNAYSDVYKAGTTGYGGNLQFDVQTGILAYYNADNVAAGVNHSFAMPPSIIDQTGHFCLGLAAACPYQLDVSKGVGLTGTARFFDQTASTGSTLVTITPGAAQTTSSTVLDIQALARFGGSNSTAAVAGVIGATCPAITCTAAYTWVKAIAADNSVVYFPVWK